MEMLRIPRIRIRNTDFFGSQYNNILTACCNGFRSALSRLSRWSPSQPLSYSHHHSSHPLPTITTACPRPCNSSPALWGPIPPPHIEPNSNSSRSRTVRPGWTSCRRSVGSWPPRHKNRSSGIDRKPVFRILSYWKNLSKISGYNLYTVLIILVWCKGGISHSHLFLDCCKFSLFRKMRR